MWIQLSVIYLSWIHKLHTLTWMLAVSVATPDADSIQTLLLQSIVVTHQHKHNGTTLGTHHTGPTLHHLLSHSSHTLHNIWQLPHPGKISLWFAVQL